jgi:carboxyl-terminal processing protease
MKRFTIIACIFLLLFSIQSKAQVYNEQLHKFGRVLTLVNSLYVDTVHEDDLVEQAIIEMLKQLDPHSIYISKEEVARMNEPLEGSFEGIGIQFRLMDDTLLVVGVVPGGPSEKVGIINGDRIITVDEKPIAGVGITNNDIMKILRGPKGTSVEVKIKRKHHKNLIDFNITRDKIPILSVDAGYITEDGIGYIKLNRFAKTTMDELEDTFTMFKKQNVKGIILDLSDNGGGYLDQAILLVDEFLKKDELIVYTEGLHNPRRDYKATSNGRFEKGKLVLIVDEGSASASEITSGAIQDWDRGVIVGRRTFGKGLVQRPFNLTDGSMIRLTIARYYTPSGRLIQKPYDNGTTEYALDVLERFNNGELINEDSIHFPDSLLVLTLENKRKVYGGGGIMPDFFIGLDTSRYSQYHYTLLRSGLLFKFVSKYVDDHREELTDLYPNIKTYIKQFEADDFLIEQLDIFAIENNVSKDTIAPASSEQDYLLKIHLKSLIAGDIWQTNEFYEVFNEINPYFQEAKRIILSDQAYNKLLNK